MKVKFKLKRVYNTYTRTNVWDVRVFVDGKDTGVGRYCLTLAESLSYIWWYRNIKLKEEKS